METYDSRAGPSQGFSVGGEARSERHWADSAAAEHSSVRCMSTEIWLLAVAAEMQRSLLKAKWLWGQKIS